MLRIVQPPLYRYQTNNLRVQTTGLRNTFNEKKKAECPIQWPQAEGRVHSFVSKYTANELQNANNLHSLTLVSSSIRYTQHTMQRKRQKKNPSSAHLNRIRPLLFGWVTYRFGIFHPHRHHSFVFSEPCIVLLGWTSSETHRKKQRTKSNWKRKRRKKRTDKTSTFIGFLFSVSSCKDQFVKRKARVDRCRQQAHRIFLQWTSFPPFLNPWQPSSQLQASCCRIELMLQNVSLPMKSK